MNSRKKPPNPWNKNPQAKSAKNNPPVPTSEVKFKEVQVKLQAAIEKHAKDYQSSSEEDELESDDVIGEILKNYTEIGGKNEFLGRTNTFLAESFQPGAASCLICISRVKRDHAIWSCSECYTFFHLECIQRWSKDSIVQQKQALDSPISVRQIAIVWGCPKCRHNYAPADIPTKYECFCKKTESPKFQPFLVPHSCGEICKKNLQPLCGHKCLLLCHPGPCPPCPVTVDVTCYCGVQPPKTQRCSSKEWSCGSRCGRLLTCGKHTCSDPCHAGECRLCGKKSLRKCLCGTEQKLRDCSSPIWKCAKICNKLLECGNHYCLEICHEEDKCVQCVLAKPRYCPCGKTKYQLACTEETPTCRDTCDKLLDCGKHTCNQRCHKDKCGLCLEVVKKLCRCGLHCKEVQCCKSYFCETKCKRLKDCNKHPCNRKCCDGSCPPCEKPCGRTLNCGNHKCKSVCHRGLCYPCNETETISCRCAKTKVTVPCGRKQKQRPPKCHHFCLIPPDCHHPTRDKHRCHFGDCPPCKQICNKPSTTCSHLCQTQCHESVLVKLGQERATMPWEQTKPQLVKKALNCPECEILVSVTCLGGHETSHWPCFKAQPTSCQRPCGRLLSCGNHACTLPCHSVDNSEMDCEKCEYACSKQRPAGCPHDCPQQCHPDDCPPCRNMVRMRCHCGLNQTYVLCCEWNFGGKKEELQSCGSQCPKNYNCGHRCRANCHSGPCPNPGQCKKKVKVFCKCKRIKKEFQCEVVQQKQIQVECDDACLEKKEEERKQLELLNERKRKEEELKNQKELEKYQKMFEGKKKSRERKTFETDDRVGFFAKYWTILLGTAFVLASLLGYLLLY